MITLRKTQTSFLITEMLKKQADEPIVRMLMLMDVNAVRNTKKETGVCTKTTEEGPEQESISSLVGVYTKQSF